MQLGHQTKDPNGNAYNRTKFLEKRKAMMQFFAFASGARSVIADFVGADEAVGEPVLYETTAPKNMAWYETQADYLIRKGEQYTAKYFAKTYHGVPADYTEATQNEWDARAYF